MMTLLRNTKSTNAENSGPDEDTTCQPSNVLQSGLEPDVIVVVGGQEFHEFSQGLCCWSGYFNGAFRSGMKETETKRFEFPDRDPYEWEWLMRLMAPLSSESVTKYNVFKALSWFDLLCVDRGLAICDDILEVLSKSCSNGRLIRAFEASVEHGLPKTKVACCSRISNQSSLDRFWPRQTQRLVAILDKDRGCREALWPKLHQYLPKACEGKQNGGELPAVVSIPLHEFVHMQLVSHFSSSVSLGDAAKKDASALSSDEEDWYSDGPRARAPVPAKKRSFLDSDSDSDSS